MKGVPWRESRGGGPLEWAINYPLEGSPRDLERAPVVSPFEVSYWCVPWRGSNVGGPLEGVTLKELPGEGPVERVQWRGLDVFPCRGPFQGVPGGGAL